LTSLGAANMYIYMYVYILYIYMDQNFIYYTSWHALAPPICTHIWVYIYVYIYMDKKSKDYTYKHMHMNLWIVRFSWINHSWSLLQNSVSFIGLFCKKRPKILSTLTILVNLTRFTWINHSWFSFIDHHLYTYMQVRARAVEITWRRQYVCVCECIHVYSSG